MDETPILKRDEQYPLLKSDGSGDGNRQNAAVTAPAWHVACTAKRSWFTRWPEFLSACWMTLVLLVISFLVFYALGMSIYRRQSVVIPRYCNNSKPARNVYYHYIVPKDTNVPFKMFSDYFSYMATQYPSLHFQIYFLMDDSLTEYSKHTKFFKRLIPQMSLTFNSIMDQNYKHDIRDFQRRYQNVNISVLNLSKYMEMTPLRFKWRKIPQNDLPFYARIYEIWQTGGIGLDMIIYNNNYKMNNKIGHEVDAILKEHNDGIIDLDKYIKTLDSIDNYDDNELITMFFDAINNMLYQTSHLFNTDMSTDIKILDNTPIVRTHRSKRDSVQVDEKVAPSLKTIVLDKEEKKESPFENKTEYNKTEFINGDINSQISYTILQPHHVEQNNTNYTLKNDSTNISVTHKDNEIVKIKLPKFHHVYNFYSFVDDSHAHLPGSSIKSGFDLHPSKTKNKKNYLTLNFDGTFIAASSRHHSFLIHLISAGCLNINPQIAIKDVFRKHCSGFIFNEPYCDSIRIFYNL